MANAKKQLFVKSTKKFRYCNTISVSESDEYSVQNSSSDLDMSFLEAKEDQIVDVNHQQRTRTINGN